MLHLHNIKKEYHMSQNTICALKGVSINFRKCEFVSILGASGCGKTTLLNIIGGLDSCTSGDLVINNRSTKEYKSRDWDRYRNNVIGFIFQSYNLIPHLNILQNVELALTLSGVGHKQKKTTATAALTLVGLRAELKKRPAELSGGQMQRVAIARAVVNNPDIILADEPTGSLDSTTSIQVMNILKELSATRLVIMVTHNEKLAKIYSSRIVEVKDGEVVSDSNPFETSQNEQIDIQPILIKDFDFDKHNKKIGIPSNPSNCFNFDKQNEQSASKTCAFAKNKMKTRSSMSLATTLSLSGKNLIKKKARTALTAFACSIGIIGIALVLSLSNGFRLYISDLEQSTLSNLPITISNVGMKIVTNESTRFPSAEVNPSDSNQVFPVKPSTSMNGIKLSANFITSDYVEYVENINKTFVSSVQYFHSMKINLMSKNSQGKVVSLKRNTVNWQELLWDNFVTSQYDTLAGGYPGSNRADMVLSKCDTNYNTYTADGKKARQAVLIINSSNTIESSVLESIGHVLIRNTDTNEYEPIDFENLLGQQIKVLHNDDFYKKDVSTGLYSTISLNTLDTVWDSEKNIEVTIVGVLRIKENVTSSILNSGIAYTNQLAKLTLADAKSSAISLDQLANKDFNVLNGNNFDADFAPLVSMFSAFGMSETSLVTLIKSIARDNFADSTDYTTQAMLKEIDSCTSIEGFVTIMNKHKISPSLLKVGISLMMSEKLGIDANIAIKILDSPYQSALQNLGADDTPSSISIYPSSFDNKQQVLEYLDAWNVGKSSTETVNYNDIAHTFVSLLTRVVNIVSYILIAFAAISLIVSCVMTCIITYISVIERTTEIGVLRAIGARKIDIANVFNAETLIIGLTSGIVGSFVAWVLGFPLNVLIAKFVIGAPKTFAVLNPLHAFLLVLLSAVLTVVSGLLPAYKASRKDPVKALRNNG